MSASKQTGRTYNQNHLARPYKQGKRRFSVYWTWSYPWEANRDLTELDNRFSTMTEVRRVAWPNYEGVEWDRMNFRRESPAPWSCSIAPRWISSGSWGRPPVIRWRSTSASIRPGAGFPLMGGFW